MRIVVAQLHLFGRTLSDVLDGCCEASARDSHLGVFPRHLFDANGSDVEFLSSVNPPRKGAFPRYGHYPCLVSDGMDASVGVRQGCNRYAMSTHFVPLFLLFLSCGQFVQGCSFFFCKCSPIPEGLQQYREGWENSSGSLHEKFL